MTRNFFMTTGAAALFFVGATAGFAQQKIANVEVEVEASAIMNEEAATFWSSLSGDLQDAIMLLIVDRIDEEGYKIAVDIDEVNLVTSFQGALGVESVLAGDVSVVSSQEPSEVNFYNLSISAMQDGATFGGTEPFSVAETQAYYEALVTKFAEAVVARLQ